MAIPKSILSSSIKSDASLRFINGLDVSNLQLLVKSLAQKIGASAGVSSDLP